ncbi:hypothetical protein [Amycolatopsis sp. H20-H5]|uniref:hypothetical protein n=1 Tax=Amycolatopsis sp. H20-H5 TaxID=3046309 RepID=UPI002DB5DF89|nr:hypothetical protein [Amycolatopsis sp. H20-H5]MEC3978438.1 hypothetical protein [Amycolatopsis sp. H20-H5]
MTEREQDGVDPTAEFLAEVRPEETPWRTERPPEAEPGHAEYTEVAGRPEKWRRTKTAGRVAGQVAPYVQAAAVVGWIASSSFGDGGGDSGGDDSGGGG